MVADAALRQFRSMCLGLHVNMHAHGFACAREKGKGSFDAPSYPVTAVDELWVRCEK